MKSCLVNTVFCLLAASACYAQGLQASEVPDSVRFAFLQKYPGVTDVQWEKDNGNYKAAWKDKSGDTYAIHFTATGCLIHVVKAIPASLLPKSVLAYLKKQFKSVSSMQTCEVIDSKGDLFYEVAFNENDLLFDAKGKFLYRQQ
jgi:hypothetical protein